MWIYRAPQQSHSLHVHAVNKNLTPENILYGFGLNCEIETRSFVNIPADTRCWFSDNKGVLSIGACESDGEQWQ